MGGVHVLQTVKCVYLLEELSLAKELGLTEIAI